MKNLTRPQEENLKILRETFGVGKWFIEGQWDELTHRINRIRFVLETLTEKGALTREMNPERGKVLDDFYRYKVNS
jgi:hypothetical protein